MKNRQALQDLDRVGESALVGPERGGEIGQAGGHRIGAGTATGGPDRPRQARGSGRKVVGYTMCVAEFGPGEGAKIGERRTAVPATREAVDLADGELGEVDHLGRRRVALGAAGLEEEFDPGKAAKTGD